jgi:PRTRC genetic system protein C
MQTGIVTREFSFNGLKLPDPDPKLSPEQVRSMLAMLYPDIATGPEAIGDKLRYNFVRAIGAKG